MSIGDRNRKIDIKKASYTRDEGFGYTSSDSTVKTGIYAQVIDKGTTEIAKGGRLETVIRHDFVINYTTGITEQMKVLYNGIVYNIIAVDHGNDRNQELILTAIADEGGSAQ